MRIDKIAAMGPHGGQPPGSRATWWLAPSSRHGAHPGDIRGYLGICRLKRIHGIHKDIRGYAEIRGYTGIYGIASLAAMRLTLAIYRDVRS